MEIPAGKWCFAEKSDCFYAQDSVDAYCYLFNCYFTHEDGGRLKCADCLAAYPNGAVVTITARGVK
jgi:hypothetical protein